FRLQNEVSRHLAPFERPEENRVNFFLFCAIPLNARVSSKEMTQPCLEDVLPVYSRHFSWFSTLFLKIRRPKKLGTTKKMKQTPRQDNPHKIPTMKSMHSSRRNPSWTGRRMSAFM